MEKNFEALMLKDKGFLNNKLPTDFAQDLFIIAFENKNILLNLVNGYDLMKHNIISLSKKYGKKYFKSGPKFKHLSRRTKRKKKSG